MPENPFKPVKKIEDTDSGANKAVIGELIGETVAAQYESLDIQTRSKIHTDDILSDEEKNVIQEHTYTPFDRLNEKLEKMGSRATIEESFEGGSLSLKIPKDIMEELQDWGTTKKAFKDADPMMPRVDGTVESLIRDNPWQPPERSDLPIVFICLDPVITTSSERTGLVSSMDVLGYRPLTLSEFIGLGIVRPDLTMQEEKMLVTYELHKVHSRGVEVVTLGKYEKRRALLFLNHDGDWNGNSVFLFTHE